MVFREKDRVSESRGSTGVLPAKGSDLARRWISRERRLRIGNRIENEIDDKPGWKLDERSKRAAN